MSAPGPSNPADASADRYKAQAAVEAVAAEVRDGMVIGLGTGTTAAHVLTEIGRVIREHGWRLRGVPTSERTAAEAERVGIPLTTLDETPDVTIDGSDQIDPALSLVKGGGGAHVREKLVALAARRVAIVADATKLVARLHGPVPLEVLPFALPWVLRVVPVRLPGSEVVLRLLDGRPARSDNGNLLVDVLCGPLDDPAAAAAALDGIAGVIGHGLFVGIADIAYVAGPGGIRRLCEPRPDDAS